MPSINKIRVGGIDYNIESSQVYSTTEQVIGKWLDEKPVYRKGFQFTKADIEALSLDSNNNRRLLPHNISNIEKVTDIRLGLNVTENSVNENLISNLNEGSSSWGVAIYNTNSTYIEVQIGQDALDILNNGFIIIEYTKTTD